MAPCSSPPWNTPVLRLHQILMPNELFWKLHALGVHRQCGVSLQNHPLCFLICIPRHMKRSELIQIFWIPEKRYSKFRYYCDHWCKCSQELFLLWVWFTLKIRYYLQVCYHTWTSTLYYAFPTKIDLNTCICDYKLMPCLLLYKNPLSVQQQIFSLLFIVEYCESVSYTSAWWGPAVSRCLTRCGPGGICEAAFWWYSLQVTQECRRSSPTWWASSNQSAA